MCYGRDDDDDWPHVPDGLGRALALVLIWLVTTVLTVIAGG